MLKSAKPLDAALRAAARAVGATIVMSIFINLSLLASPIYSVQVNDRVLASKNGLTLLVLTGIVVVFLALYGILEYVRGAIQVEAGVRFDRMLRRPLFEATMRAELAGRVAEGQRALRDADFIRDGLAGGLIPTLCDIPWVPVFVGLSFYLHPLLGEVSLVGASLILMSAVVTELLMRSNVTRAAKLQADASHFAASAFKNVEVVKGLGMGGTVIDRWSETQTALVATQAISGERSAAILAVSKFVRQLVQTALLGVGAWLVIEQEITPGIMMASSIIMGRALAPVEQTVAQWRRIIGLRGAYRRIADLMTAFAGGEETTRLPVPVGQIDVEDVYVVPPSGSRPVVKGVSLSLRPGEVLAIVGASGSGKSSLARALAGVWQPRAGSVRIDGTDYVQWNADELGQHIGYLPQSVELFAGTVAENIARLGQVDPDKVIAAAKAAGAHDLIVRLPKGYDTPIGESGTALSGGTRQRVGLARALYGDPRLVVLDEPNANLDEDGEKALAAAIAGMKTAGRAVVVVTHRPQILTQVDLMLVMTFGQKLAFGARDEVINSMRGNRVALAKT